MTKRTYVVVALFAPMAVGTSFSRSNWPAHVTLASNFLTDATVGELERAVGRADASSEPLIVPFTHLAQFGPNRDVPVRLVQSDRVSILHNRLADGLAQITWVRSGGACILVGRLPPSSHRWGCNLMR